MLGDVESNKSLFKLISNLKVKISDLLESEMKYFAIEVQESVFDIVTYLFYQGGKRLRPAFFIQIAEQLNGKSELGPFALVIELIHNMSLIHDDIIDEANERRGGPTVHHKWDVATAIVGGDILHSLIHRHIINAAKMDRIETSVAIDFLYELLEVEIEIGNSVLLEMQQAKLKNLPPIADALRITAGKTAPLFAFSAKAAAIISNRKDIADILYEFGYQFGFGFQLLDDLLDYFSSDKDIGGDLREGKKTPIIILISKTSPELINTSLGNINCTIKDTKMIRDSHKSEFMEVVSWIEGYFETARQKIESIGIEMVQLEVLFNLVMVNIESIKNHY